MIAALVTLGRRIAERPLHAPTPFVGLDLYLPPADRACLLTALWAMSDNDEDIAFRNGHEDLELAYHEEGSALEDAASAARMAHAAWEQTLPVERVG